MGYLPWTREIRDNASFCLPNTFLYTISERRERSHFTSQSASNDSSPPPFSPPLLPCIEFAARDWMVYLKIFLVFMKIFFRKYFEKMFSKIFQKKFFENISKKFFRKKNIYIYLYLHEIYIHIFFFFNVIWSARGGNTHVRSRARARRINDLRKWYRLGWGYARVVCGSAGWVWRGEGVQVARGWRASCVIGCLMSQGRTWRDPPARIRAEFLGVYLGGSPARRRDARANFSPRKSGDPIRGGRGSRTRDAPRGCILVHFRKKIFFFMGINEGCAINYTFLFTETRVKIRYINI